MFDAYGIQNFDIAGALEISSARNVSSNLKIPVPKIILFSIRNRRPLVGSVLLFVDREFLEKSFLDEVASALPHEDDRGWDTLVWDEDSPTAGDLNRTSHRRQSPINKRIISI